MAAIMLGGKTFTVQNQDARTVDCWHHQRKLLNETGLAQMVPNAAEMDAGAEEAAAGESWLLRLHSKLLDSCKACELIATYLLPSGKTETDWTPALAEDMAAHFKRCNVEHDRQLIDELAMEFIVGFFRQATVLLMTSLKFSQRADDRLQKPGSPAAH